MSDVFISYKREDQARVRQLHDALCNAGLSVWWDLDTEGGAAWRQRILQELDAAKCVVVVWSRLSVGEQATWVFEEAGRAAKRGVLLPVKIEKVSPPFGFGEYQILDLVGWHGNERDLRFHDVLASVRAMLAGQARPRPLWPARRRRTLALSAVSASFMATLVAALLLPPLQRGLCALPGIRRLCGTLEECWVDRTSRFRLRTSVSDRPFPSREAALADARRRADIDAQDLCFEGDRTMIRNVAVSPSISEENCRQLADGHICGLDGWAVCKQQKRALVPAGTCQP